MLCVAWSVVLAPLQGPDEHNHAGYVQHMAETGSGPKFAQTQGGTWSTEQTELMRWQDLLGLIGVANARPGWTQAEEAEYQRRADTWTGVQRKDGSGPNPVAQNPPLYYAYDSLAYQVGRVGELPTRLLLMRLANLPLFLLTILFAWLAAGELFRKRRWLQTITAGAVALLPQLAFISGVVNPDVMLATVWAALTWLVLRAVRVGLTPVTLLSLGAVTAASALTHGRGLPAFGPLIVTLLVLLWRARPLSRRAVALTAGGVVVAVIGVAAAFLYSRGHGGVASLADEAGSTTAEGSLKGFLSYVWQFYFGELRSLSPQGPPYGYRQVYVEGLTGVFGSLEILFPLWVYDVMQVAAAVGLLVLLACLVRRWEWVRRHVAQLVVLVSVPLSMLLVLHAAAYRDLQTPPHDPLITGRYLLPLATLMGLAIAFVCLSVPRPVGRALGAAVLTVFCVLCVCGLGLTVVRFYA